MGFTKKLFLAFIFASALSFTIVVVKFTKSCACLSSFLFQEITLNHIQSEPKWALIRKIALNISIFLFAHTAFVMVCRMFLGKSSPATQEDPTYIKLLNRIIANTIEQAVIFLGLFTYFLIDGSSEQFEQSLLLNIPSWFILGRVLFSAGYILGSMVKLPQLRSYGFALNVFVNVLLLEYVTLTRPYVSPLILSL